MSTVVHDVTTPFQKATFGMGCFWVCDALIGGQQGILRTRVGYSGGTTIDPNCTKLGDHTEVIEIDFDPTIISYEDLLRLFWNNHENGLVTVTERQYLSLILYHNEEQKDIAEKVFKEAEPRKTNVVTEIARAGPFYPAEDCHQKHRLQEHPWLCEEIGLSPKLLQTSHAAARLNGYVAGIGKEDDLEQDIVALGLSEKSADFVRKQWHKNKKEKEL